MKTVKNIFRHLLLVLPLILVASCNFGGDNSSSSSSKILSDAAKDVNKSCPQRVDEVTVLKEVSYKNHVFTYVYEVEASDDAEIIMEADDDVLVEVLSEELQSKAYYDSDVEAFVEELRKDNATLIYRYSLTDGSGRSRDIKVNY